MKLFTERTNVEVKKTEKKQEWQNEEQSRSIRQRQVVTLKYYHNL